MAKIGDTVYSIYKRKETEEYHIVQGEIISIDKDGKITCNTRKKNKSICKKMDINDNISVTRDLCLLEDDIRKITHKYKRTLCGVCVSHLYLTFD